MRLPSGALVTATGEPAVGKAEGTTARGHVVHHSGWLGARRRVAGAGPPRLLDVWVDAVTLDAAVVVYAASEEVSAEVVFWQGGRWSGRRQGVAPGTVRLSGLMEGSPYRYRLTLRDADGDEVSSELLGFCTPAREEVVRRRVLASYFSDPGLQELHGTREEPGIDQPAGSDGNPRGDFSTGAGPDGFSARWTGLVRIRSAGAYTWHGSADDGQRLVVDALPLLESWEAGSGRVDSLVVQALDASWHALTYEMFEGTGDALARLELERPDGSRAPLDDSELAYVSEDFFRPTIVPREVPVVLECASHQGTAATLDPPEAWDCRDPAPVVRGEAEERFSLGDNRVVWTATNRTGQRSYWAEDVTVEDSLPPVLSPPPAVTAEAVPPLGTIVDLPAVEVEDVCDAAPEVTWHVCSRRRQPCRPCWTAEDEAADPAHLAGARDPSCLCEDAPDRYPLGTTRVTAIARDDSGWCADAGTTVTVRDTTAPSVDPGGIELVCRRAPIPPAIVRDNVTLPEAIVVACRVDDEARPGSCDRVLDFALGPHHVDYTAWDEAGNARTVRLPFTVGDQDPVPPLVELLERTEGFVAGAATVAVRVVDNCDVSPSVAFSPDPDSVEVEGRQHLATWTAEGVYAVDVAARDAAGNVRTLSDLVFGIDGTVPEASLSSPEAPDDPDDPWTRPVWFPGETVPISGAARDVAGAVSSGLDRVELTLTRLSDEESWALAGTDLPPDAGEPARGPLRVKNLACAVEEVVPDEVGCDGDGALVLGALASGDYRITVAARDRAGNSGTAGRVFTVMSWRLALERAAERADALLAGELPALARLLLAQVPEVRDDAVHAAGDPDLVGNALLYSYTVVDALQTAAAQGVDPGDTASWLARAAYYGVADRWASAVDALGGDDPDLMRAADLLDEARDRLGSEPPALLAALLALLNAHFYVEHGLDPFVIEDEVDALLAEDRLLDRLSAYLDDAAVNGREWVVRIAEEQRAIRDGNLLRRVAQRDMGDTGRTNEAFLELLVRLNEMSGLMAQAQDEWVWVRNWQWPLSLEVRVVAGLGLDAAALQLGEDRLQPRDRVLAYAREQYDLGVEFIDDRLVDDALEVYVDQRCLIHEVYNRAGFLPQAVPPDDWGCDTCVLTGTCER